MTFLICNELKLFGICLLLGVLIGLFYDVFRIGRKLIVHKEWLVDLEDLFFWMLTAWFVFRTLFQYNQGALRGYAFLGMFLGVILYECSFSRLLLFMTDKIVPYWNNGKQFVKKPVVLIKNGIRNLLKKLVFEVKMAIKGR